MKSSFAVSLFTASLLLLTSCKQQPGDGGLATIHGKVYGYDINNFGLVVDSGYVSDTRVSISYGDNTWSDNDTRTSYTGEYVFPYLHTGNYTVWVINKCDTCTLGQSYDIRHVTINNPRETVEVSDLINYF